MKKISVVSRMSWVPRIVGPLFRALRFTRRPMKLISRVGRRGRIQAMKFPVRKPGSALVKRHLKKKKIFRKRRIEEMVYRPRRSRRVIRRRRYIKKIANRVHKFVRWADKDTTYGTYGPNAINETGADQHLTYQFKLDNVTAPTDFTNLYDMYRVDKIQLFLEPRFGTSSEYYNNLNVISNRLRVVHDYTDATPLSNEDEYLQYASCKSYIPTRLVRITLYPSVNNVIENVGGAVNGFTSMKAGRQWFNIDTDEIPMFGIKMFIPGGILNASDVNLFKVRAKFWLSFKNSK